MTGALQLVGVCLFVCTRPAGAAWLTLLITPTLHMIPTTRFIQQCYVTLLANHIFPAGLYTEEPQRTSIGNRVTLVGLGAELWSSEKVTH
jgi:hypothetical protein